MIKANLERQKHEHELAVKTQLHQHDMVAAEHALGIQREQHQMRMQQAAVAQSAKEMAQQPNA